MEVLPVGITTRADFQKSLGRASASGAFGRVGSSPRLRTSSTWLREYRAVVDFLFMFARLLGADDADNVLVTPCVDDTINLRFGSAQSDPSHVAVILTVVDSLQPFIAESRSSGEEGDAMLIEVASGFGFVPFEFKVLLGH